MKQRLWKGMAALFTCAALLIPGTVMYTSAGEIPIQAENADEFVIEDGVLVEYNGEAAEVTVPEGVTSIGYGAFGGCESLSSITLPEGVTSIGSRAFERCGSLSSITLPDGVTSIGNEAFSGCSSLSSINLPDGVTSIGMGAFSKCSSLADIEVAEQNSHYASYDGCLYNKDLTELIQVPCGKNEVKLSDHITSIGDGAFRSCSSLSSITLPEGVTSIGEWAFSGCSSLSSITLPEGVTSIGTAAFLDCSSLSSITLPESLTSIENRTQIGGTFECCDENLTIHCKEGSYAQKFAVENGIKYALINAEPETPAGASTGTSTEASAAAPKHEVTLSSDNTGITSSEMKNCVDINQTQDVVISAENGIKFTFPKGSMKMVDGKDNYDFSAKIITDYTQLAKKPFAEGAEGDFAFQINYSYEGELPGTAEISIPVDQKWIGKTLYYYQVTEDGTYTYMTEAVVDENGIYTIRQSHCSDYAALAVKIASTEADSTNAASTETDSTNAASTETDSTNVSNPNTGDVNMMWFAAMACLSAAGVIAVRRKQMAE